MVDSRCCNKLHFDADFDASGRAVGKTIVTRETQKNEEIQSEYARHHTDDL